MRIRRSRNAEYAVRAALIELQSLAERAQGRREFAGFILVLIALFGAVSAGGGCTSVQVIDATTGLPRVIGWGSATNIQVAKGTLCRIRSPGLSLRLHSYDPGFSMGWHETLLFLPSPAKSHPSKPPLPVAIYVANYGIGLGPYFLLVGSDSAFEVYEPAPGESFLQAINFVPSRLTDTVITKEQK